MVLAQVRLLGTEQAKTIKLFEIMKSNNLSAKLEKNRKEHFKMVSGDVALNGGSYYPGAFAGRFARPLTSGQIRRIYKTSKHW